MSLFITGAGIVTENIPDFSFLFEHQIQDFDDILPKENAFEYLSKRWPFQSKALIGREDRGLLNKIAQLAIDTSRQAIQMSERMHAYSDHLKQNFPIFSATEIVDYELSCLDRLLDDSNNNPNDVINRLGETKKHLNPLDMLRMLSTNPLYHLSKIFELNGGGYPVRKMSLSSLSALELANIYLRNNSINQCLVSSVGNLCMAENLTLFIKMGLLRTTGVDNGIVPAYGSASLVLSKDKNVHDALGEILFVSSAYHSKSTVTKEDWLHLYKELGEVSESINVIYYNNGVSALFDEEQKAVDEYFSNPFCYSYKPYIGYTGKSNNLIDLVIALSDKRIPKNSLVLINGIGTGVGLGCILLRKF